MKYTLPYTLPYILSYTLSYVAGIFTGINLVNQQHYRYIQIKENPETSI